MNKIILNKIDVQQKKIIYSYSIEGNLKKYFKNCETKRTSYNHSTQGKGNINLEELLFIAYN